MKKVENLEDELIWTRFKSRPALESALKKYNGNNKVSLCLEEKDKGDTSDSSYLGNFGGYDVTIWFAKARCNRIVTGVSIEKYDE